MTNFNKMEQVAIPEKYRVIKLRYIGDDQVLISNLIDSNIKEMLEIKEVNFISTFHSIQEWTITSHQGTNWLGLDALGSIYTHGTKLVF